MKRHMLLSYWVGLLMFVWHGIALAEDQVRYLLPLKGEILTDNNGHPLNDSVSLEFKMCNDVNLLDCPWSEKHDQVSINQGKFFVFLGSKSTSQFSNNFDFTKEKFIRLTVHPKGQDSYDLRPPLQYLPVLGAWQAAQADNAANLEGHGWNDIEIIKETIYSELKKLREETLLPSGTVIAFDRNECPAGWKPFAEGRTIIGVGQGRGLTMRNLKDQGGVEKVKLTINEIPSHQHQNPTQLGSESPSEVWALQATGLGSYSGKHVRPTQEVGGGQSHENMPPFIALRLCRKD